MSNPSYETWLSCTQCGRKHLKVITDDGHQNFTIICNNCYKIMIEQFNKVKELG